MALLKRHEQNAHATMCFQYFLENERKLCGEWAVFYHSYSFAAVLYEVHAAVGAVLFRFRSHYAPLPRILMHEFQDIPDAGTLAERFAAEFAGAGRDHHPTYRKVCLSAMCSLMAIGPETCPTTAFTSGYSEKDVHFRGVLEGVLEACYVPRAEVRSLADSVILTCETHGLDVTQFGGRPCESGRTGHLLQIFIRRELVDLLTYAALPYGMVDSSRMPLSDWLSGDGPFALGQARVVAHPKIFMQANSVRMYVASADPAFHRNRSKFQLHLTELLKAILGEPSVREHAAAGIYGGTLPAWWTDEDQRNVS